MRTSINTTFTNRNVFGTSQGRVVSLCNEAYAHAAQHLASWHASNRLRRDRDALKRRVDVVVTGAVGLVELMCLAITEPQRQPVRPMSPVLVRI